MATRQADPLSEFLCLYRVLEGADNNNGKSFAAKMLPKLQSANFGELWVIGADIKLEKAINAFEVYRERATAEMAMLGTTDQIADRLYEFRNSIAHGARNTIKGVNTNGIATVTSALSIVKLLARLAVESSLSQLKN